MPETYPTRSIGRTSREEEIALKTLVFLVGFGCAVAWGFLACPPEVLLCRGAEVPVRGRCLPASEVPEGGTDKEGVEGGEVSGVEEKAEAGAAEKSEVAREAVAERPGPSEVGTETMGICRLGESRCAGVILQVCQADGKGWEDRACEGGSVCQEGRCQPKAACKEGESKACYEGPEGTAKVGLCKEGVATCKAGVWGACQGQVLPKAEICQNAQDDDCDGSVDEGCSSALNLQGRWRRVSDKAPYRYELQFLAGDRFEFFHAGASVGKGTYQVQGSSFQWMDDPGTNCTQAHPTHPWGKYSVSLQGGVLTFVAVSDLCFSREGFLTFEGWVLQ